MLVMGEEIISLQLGKYRVIDGELFMIKKGLPVKISDSLSLGSDLELQQKKVNASDEQS